MKISVIGSGYVGLVTAAGLAKLGHKVICVDKSKEIVDIINSKKAHYYEAGIEDILQAYVPSSLSATTDLKQAVLDSEITFICVGTPSRKEGKLYDAQIVSASEEIGEALKSKSGWHLVVVKSTVVPETTEKTVIPALEMKSGKTFPKDFGVCMNPEFLREGQALKDFFDPDRIVIGSSDEKSRNKLNELYAGFSSAQILLTNFKEAEMIKYASNTFLAAKISLINELGNICKKLGIDTNVVSKGVGLEKRIGPQFLRSGIGFGGSCFPKDVKAIIYKATQHGYTPTLLNAIMEVNEKQPLKLLEIIEDHLKNHERIAILGLTFKADTDDIRESPALRVIKELVSEGQKDIYVYDPLAMKKAKEIYPQLTYVFSGQEAVDKASVVLILTEWPEFRNINYGDKLVIDGKNLFEGKNLPKNYQGVCW
jgi:UDPglucose 6-dehydrogenase